MKLTTIKNILVFLLAFLGMGAIVVGSILIISPSGQLIDIPLSTLKHTPFNSFLIPGILFVIVLGLIPSIIAIVLTYTNKRHRIKRENTL